MKRTFLSQVFLLVIFVISVVSCSKDSNSEPPDTRKWVVSTYAGSGTEGKADGDSVNASFSYPQTLTIDPSGNLFVSDVTNLNIRKISTDRRVSTYAGKDISTPDPLYGHIYGLVTDMLGTIFGVEYAMIRKISSPTVNSVFVGGLVHDFRDGQDTAARFNVTSSIAIDKNDVMYMTDFDKAGIPQIRKITPDGMVTTLTLQDNTGYSYIGGPNHFYHSVITVDGEGNIYLTANQNNIIKKITKDGKVTVFAGAGHIGFKDGQGESAQFYGVCGMVTDADGNIFLADGGNNAIRKVTKDGNVTTLAGGEKGHADGEGNKAKFNLPIGITINKDGVLYVADMDNHRIRKIEYIK